MFTFTPNERLLKTKKIVITGSPSTGKTSVIEKLESLGYSCLHEVIREMTLESKRENETIRFKSNPIISVSDPEAFNSSILKARIQQYQSIRHTKEALFFFDRGIPDVLAYMDCFKQTYTINFTEACKNHPYDLILLMPPWKEIYATDNERFETYEESLLIHECLYNRYQQLGYEPTLVPKLSINERVNFILDRIK